MRLTLGRALGGLTVLGGLIAVGAYWIGPGVVPRAKLMLLTLDADSRFAADAVLAAADEVSGRPARYPLIMALRNTGEREATPTALTLSVPGWVRLENQAGPIEPVPDAGQEPLRRYAIELAGEPIEPGALPQVPAGLDDLAMVVELPAMTCSLRWDGVPEFHPNPDWDPERLSRITTFYSLEDRRGRQTGVLTLRLDPDRIRPAAAHFTTGDVSIERPGVGLPATDSLILELRQESTCGAPERRVRLESESWRTGPTGAGRIIIIRHADKPRRFLLDADADGTVEREYWDGDGDGLFEASRMVSFAIPAFILPEALAVQESAAPAAPAAGQAPADSMAVAAVDSLSGAAIDTTRTDTLAVDTIGVDTLDVRSPVVDTLGVSTLAVDPLRTESRGAGGASGFRDRDRAVR